MGTKTVNVTDVIESSRFVGLPLRLCILVFIIMLIDGFDLASIGFVAPAVLADWGLERPQIFPVLASSIFGMAVGSIILGWLGDKIGRKSSYIVCIAFLAVGSALSALSGDVTHLVINRFITGIGLGGVTPLAATLITEWTSKRARGLAVVCIVVAVPFGGLVGSEAAKHIIPAFGWRGVFWIGAIAPLVFFLIAQFLLPESPVFLARDPKRYPALAKALNALVGEKRYTGEETFIATESYAAGKGEAPKGNWLAALFGPALLLTTILFWVAITANSMALYAIVNVLPTMLTTAGGMTQDVALTSMTWFNFGGVAGAVCGAALIGSFGSRRIGVFLALCGGAAALALGAVSLGGGLAPGVQLFALVGVAGMALNGMQTFLYTVGANSYPATLRASGVGAGQTVSRAGVFILMVYGAQMFPNLPIYFFIISGFFAVVVLSYGSMRTHLNSKKRILEMEAEALRDGAAT